MYREIFLVLFNNVRHSSYSYKLRSYIRMYTSVVHVNTYPHSTRVLHARHSRADYVMHARYSREALHKLASTRDVTLELYRAGILGYFTNHSLCVSAATRLYDAWVDENAKDWLQVMTRCQKIKKTVKLKELSLNVLYHAEENKRVKLEGQSDGDGSEK